MRFSQPQSLVHFLPIVASATHRCAGYKCVVFWERYIEAQLPTCL
jgi:hypothetical protein